MHFFALGFPRRWREDIPGGHFFGAAFFPAVDIPRHGGPLLVPRAGVSETGAAPPAGIAEPRESIAPKL